MNGIDILNWLRPDRRFEKTRDEPQPTMRKDKGKTRKGATHKIGAHFRSRSIMGISPAQYRRFSKAARREEKIKHKNSILARQRGMVF